jgi:hypothetical protein
MIGFALRRRAGLAAAAIALTAVSGCSLVFVDAPPRDHASRHFFDCTTSMLAPGLDATMAGIMALGVVGAMSDGSHDSASAVDGALVAAGALASATYGYLRVSRCRDAKEKLSERLLDMPYLGLPPPGLPGAPQAAAGAAGSTPDTPATDLRTTPTVGRDPWLSEGPPPPPTYPRHAPTFMPPPPPYLRLAPQEPAASPQPPAAIAPPVPTPSSPATAPPPAATTAPKPAPNIDMPQPTDAGSQP